MSRNNIDLLLRINSETRALRDTQRQVQQLRVSFSQLVQGAAAFVGIQAGINGVRTAFRASVQDGLAFNQTVQDTTDSLRAMALAGEAQGDMQQAIRASSEAVDILRRRANETGEVFSNVVQIFQESAAVAQTNGISLREWADIAVDATRAGANMGLSVERIRTQLAQIAIGEVRTTNVFATALGLDRETLQAAQEAGNTVDLLREKLAPYQTRIEGTTAAQARFANVMQEVWGNITLPLFEQLEDSTRNITDAISENGSELERFGIFLADVARMGMAGVQALIRWGPALIQIGGAITAIAMGRFLGHVTGLVAGLRLATGATTGLTAAKMRLLTVLRAIGLANPYTAVLTAVTAIGLATYNWNLRQREAERRAVSLREENERINSTLQERLGILTSEEEREARIREINQQIADLEEQIKNTRGEGRVILRDRGAALLRELELTNQLTDAELRSNAQRRQEEARRRRDLAQLPERIEAFEEAQERRRLEALSTQDRLNQLLEREAAIREQIGGQSAADVERLRDLIAGRRAAIDAARAEQQGTPERVDSPTQRGATIANPERAQSQQQIEAMATEIQRAESELSQLLAGLNELDQVTAEAAEARTQLEQDQAQLRQELRQMETQEIRLAEQELRQSFERQGGNAERHYSHLSALAAERWDREIELAQEAVNSAETDAAREVAAIRLSNAQRERAIELRGIALDRDRQIASTAREAYQTQLDMIRRYVDALDSAILSEGDVNRRTELEQTRAAYVERALEAFREYQGLVQGMGLPGDDVQAPEFAQPEQRASRFERAAQEFTSSSPEQSFQSAQEGLIGGLMEYANQLGTVWDQISDMIQGVASSITNGIGNALTGVIMRTTTWADAMRNIATSIISQVIQSIVNMATEWIIRQVLMASAGQQIQAASLATSMKMAAASSAALSMIWAPAATMATIASFGAAAAQAPIAIQTAQAITTATAAIPGLEAGGFTASGPASKPQGIVHSDEWVAPQWMTKSPTFAPLIASLEEARINRGSVNYDLTRGFQMGGFTSPGMDSGSSRPPTDNSRGQRTVIVDNRRDADRLRADPDFETIVVDAVERNRGGFSRWI